jgi:hypothetical protein
MKKVECKVCGDYGVVATNPRAKCRHRDCPEHCKAWEKLHLLLEQGNPDIFSVGG